MTTNQLQKAVKLILDEYGIAVESGEFASDPECYGVCLIECGAEMPILVNTAPGEESAEMVECSWPPTAKGRPVPTFPIRFV